MKLDKLAQKPTANVNGYENFRSRGENNSVEITVGPEDKSPLKMLPGYKPQREKRDKGPKENTGVAGIKMAEASDVLNDYFKLLSEATDKNFVNKGDLESLVKKTGEP